MSNYEKLDFLIYKSIKERSKGFSELFDGEVREEAKRLSAQHCPSPERPAFRFVDARLQSLRKRGLIEFVGGVWRRPIK